MPAIEPVTIFPSALNSPTAAGGNFLRSMKNVRYVSGGSSAVGFAAGITQTTRLYIPAM